MICLPSSKLTCMSRDYNRIYYLFITTSETTVCFGSISSWVQCGGACVRWWPCSEITARMPDGSPGVPLRGRAGEGQERSLICLARKDVQVRVNCSCQAWAISVTFHSQEQSLKCHHLILWPCLMPPKSWASSPALRSGPSQLTYFKEPFAFYRLET